VAAERTVGEPGPLPQCAELACRAIHETRRGKGATTCGAPETSRSAQPRSATNHDVAGAPRNEPAAAMSPHQKLPTERLHQDPHVTPREQCGDAPQADSTRHPSNAARTSLARYTSPVTPVPRRTSRRPANRRSDRFRRWQSPVHGFGSRVPAIGRPDVRQLRAAATPRSSPTETRRFPSGEAATRRLGSRIGRRQLTAPRAAPTRARAVARRTYAIPRVRSTHPTSPPPRANRSAAQRG